MLSHSILPIGGQRSISGARLVHSPFPVQYSWTCRNSCLCYIVSPISGSGKNVTNHEACAARQTYRHSGIASGLWTSRAILMAPYCCQLQRSSRLPSGSSTLRAGLMVPSCWQTAVVNDLGQPLSRPACHLYITCAMLHTSPLPLQNRALTRPKTFTVR